MSSTMNLEAETIRRTFCDYTASPRMVWNSGFWDGYNDRRNGRPERRQGAAEQPLPTWSPFYTAGYTIGYDADAHGHDSSEPEWETFVAVTNEATLRLYMRHEDGSPENRRSRGLRAVKGA